jgi:hypothetical protein
MGLLSDSPPEPNWLSIRRKKKNKTMKITLTWEMLHDCATNHLGWNKDQIKLLGTTCPLRHGWLRNLIGTEIEESTWNQVMQLRHMTRAKRKALKKAEQGNLILPTTSASSCA